MSLHLEGMNMGTALVLQHLDPVLSHLSHVLQSLESTGKRLSDTHLQILYR